MTLTQTPATFKPDAPELKQAIIGFVHAALVREVKHDALMAEYVARWERDAANGDIHAQTELASRNDTFHWARTRAHPMKMLREQSCEDLQKRATFLSRQKGYKWERLAIERIQRERKAARTEQAQSETAEANAHG